MEPTLLVTMGDATLSVARLSVQEMLKVKTWTGMKNRPEFLQGIAEQDPEALIAAYCLAKSRDGQTVRFTEVDFELGDLKVTLQDPEGREIEPVFDTTDEGAPKLDGNGRPVQAVDKQGNEQWRFVESGEPVPPTAPASTET